MCIYGELILANADMLTLSTTENQDLNLSAYMSHMSR